MRNSKGKNIVFSIVGIILLAILVVGLYNILTMKETKKWSEIISDFENEKVTYVKVDNDGTLTYTINGENGVKKTYAYKLSYTQQFDYLNEKCTQLYLAGKLDSFDYEQPKSTPAIVKYIPYAVFFLLIIGFWIFMINQNGEKGGKIGSITRSHVKGNVDEKHAVKFADVAGADEEKEELQEIVEFLKDPKKFVRLGARIPHGVLLVGPPGTGKTLLAKAVAGEAGVPFFSISGSDFVELYVGVGASRVRDLFANARKSPASIIFIDEIDAVGRQRGTGLGGGHDEREQTLNQLLVEMDGFGGQEGVIVIAATNRPDVLDPALLRPGRFDRQVTVNYPDIKGREEILRVHVRNKPIEGSVDLHKIALTTVGFTGADLANLMNEAALLAAKRGKNLIGMQDISDSYMKVLLGPQKKSKIRTEHDNMLCAYHEAGHAIAAYMSPHADPVKHITIIPAGSAGGVTLMVPEHDKMGNSRNEMLEDIVVSLGGRVAEEIMMDDISTGASSDIQNATKVARDMVTRFGMSDKLGPVLYGSGHSDTEVFLGRDFNTSKNYSEKTASEIDDEIRRIIEEAHGKCKVILESKREKLEFVAKYLLAYEFMDGDIFKIAMESDKTIEELAQIVEEQKKKSDAENAEAASLDERVENMLRERNQGSHKC